MNSKIDKKIIIGSLALASIGLAAYLLHARATTDALEIKDDTL
jgi:hypothetical protein